MQDSSKCEVFSPLYSFLISACGGKYKGLANLPKAQPIDVREKIAALAGGLSSDGWQDSHYYLKRIIGKDHLNTLAGERSAGLA
jgi:hypothetical protein